MYHLLMIRRLLAPLILAGCAEHTSEYQDLLDKFGSETTVESSTTTTPTAGASTMTAGDSAGTTEASTENSGATGPNPGDDTGQSSSETPGASTGQSSSETTGASAGLPSDPRPTVTDLVCDPEKAEEIGPVSCTYLASADAVEAELLDDGEVVAAGPAGPPLIFPVTSAPHNNPGTTITVVVRDEAGQTAETSIFQPSTVKDPGTAVWTKLEPNDGAFSMGNAVALQGDHVIAAGVHFKNPLVVGTLRRYGALASPSGSATVAERPAATSTVHLRCWSPWDPPSRPNLRETGADPAGPASKDDSVGEERRRHRAGPHSSSQGGVTPSHQTVLAESHSMPGSGQGGSRSTQTAPR